jgi:antibiotic biosynthesis monooxygenase (ABM) superfamily enzyme
MEETYSVCFSKETSPKNISVWKNAKITNDVIYAFKNQNRMPFLVPVVTF